MVLVFVSARRPVSSSTAASRTEWPWLLNAILSAPVSMSRSSVKLGAWAMAVPVACHMPSCGLALAMDRDARRARPMMPELGSSLLLAMTNEGVPWSHKDCDREGEVGCDMDEEGDRKKADDDQAN